jgi:ubiquinone/menaquinone biosynthesis C-methylase UbiE
MTVSNKHQWFDGWIYSALIAPNLKFIFKKVYDIFNKQSTVLDVACGTGFFALNYYANFLKIVGVDLSSVNINKAHQLKQRKNIKNIEFIHQDATKLNEIFPKNAFDYSFISLALHEMPENIRSTVIKQMSEVSQEQLFIDYSFGKLNYSTLIVYLSEFFAGREHFNNFLNFKKNGGLIPLIQQVNLEIIAEYYLFKYNLKIIHTKSK